MVCADICMGALLCARRLADGPEPRKQEPHRVWEGLLHTSPGVGAESWNLQGEFPAPLDWSPEGWASCGASKRSFPTSAGSPFVSPAGNRLASVPQSSLSALPSVSSRPTIPDGARPVICPLPPVEGRDEGWQEWQAARQLWMGDGRSTCLALHLGVWTWLLGGRGTGLPL